MTWVFVRRICTPSRKRFCLVKKNKKVYFDKIDDLVAYWTPKVDMNNPRELSEYSHLFFKKYKK